MKTDWENDQDVRDQLISAGLQIAEARQQEQANRIEEIPCDSCGCPIFIGGGGNWETSGAKVYCSKICARDGERRNAQIIKPQPKGVKAGPFSV